MGLLGGAFDARILSSISICLLACVAMLLLYFR